MSQNDFISLKLSDDGMYVVKHMDVDSGNVFSSFEYEGLVPSLKQAQALQDEYQPEYGITLDI